jgi:salicylate hydroxylase
MPILVAGGGIGGLSTAIALAHYGMESVVLEQADSFSEVGAGIQIGPNGMLVLEQLGVSKYLVDRGAYPEAVRMFDGLSGRQLNEVPLGAYAEARYGAPYRIFHRAELQAALLEAARARPQIAIRNGFRIKDFAETEDSVTVRSVGGGEATGELLIGADGLWSRIRRQLYPAITPTFYGKSAWRTVVDAADVPKPFSDRAVGLWMAPDAHLVHYPVMGGRKINIVAVITEKFDKVGWSNEGASTELMRHYDHWASAPRQFLHAAQGWQKWALFALERLPRWSRGRVVLLGDAAHPPIPFLAQGGVMAIEDAYALATELDLNRRDHTVAFRQYEARRRNRAYHVMEIAHKLGRIYHMQGPMRLARNFVLSHKRSEKLLADYDWLYGFVFEARS